MQNLRLATPMFPKYRIKFITNRARVVFATRACNIVKVHTRSISTKRANRPFRTHGLSGSTGLQDIAAETRKRVNASTLSLTSIRLVHHRINGMPQFPSALPPLSPRSCATPVRPCHFIWQDSNNRRSIIHRNKRTYMTIYPIYPKENN